MFLKERQGDERLANRPLCSGPSRCRPAVPRRTTFTSSRSARASRKMTWLLLHGDCRQPSNSVGFERDLASERSLPSSILGYAAFQEPAISRQPALPSKGQWQLPAWSNAPHARPCGSTRFPRGQTPPLGWKQISLPACHVARGAKTIPGTPELVRRVRSGCRNRCQDTLASPRAWPSEDQEMLHLKLRDSLMRL